MLVVLVALIVRREQITPGLSQGRSSIGKERSIQIVAGSSVRGGAGI